MTAERPIIVVKIGSSSLVDARARLDLAVLDRLAGQLKEVVAAGWRPVLVSSGAVACGLGLLGLASRPTATPAKQALAAIGQATLMQRWQAALDAHGLVAAQVLLTDDDFTERSRWLNLSAAFKALFAYGAVPVINENDTVAVEELTVGDNDRLSALVAIQLHARRLLLLTDIDGVYDADPRTHPQARLLGELDGVPRDLLVAAGGAGKVGRGGMRSKLEAARLAGGTGVETVIASAAAAQVIVRVCADEPVGTRIRARGAAAADGRRRWLGAGRRARGRLTIDGGAAAALLARGKSLLPAGIRAVSGRFAAGDTVVIATETGDEIARGAVEIDAEALGRILGMRLDRAAEVLGAPLPRGAVVHRDHMLVLAKG